MLDGVNNYPISAMFLMASVKLVFCLHYVLPCLRGSNKCGTEENQGRLCARYNQG